MSCGYIGDSLAVVVENKRKSDVSSLSSCGGLGVQCHEEHVLSSGKAVGSFLALEKQQEKRLGEERSQQGNGGGWAVRGEVAVL